MTSADPTGETTEGPKRRFSLPRVRRRGRPWIRHRWLRGTVRVLRGRFVLGTLFSFVYNLATSGDQKPASALYPGPYVQIDGRTVAYRELGSRGSPIILLGGFAEPSWVWKPVMRRLALGHRVYALDLPPFGYSERKGPYSLAGWTRLVRDFAAHFNLRQPVIVGHSRGGRCEHRPSGAQQHCGCRSTRRRRATSRRPALDGEPVPQSLLHDTLPP